MESRFQVGVITQTHGLKGEVKVYPTTDDNRRFKRLKEVILDNGRQELLLEVEQVKFFKQMVILKFKGYDTIEAVEKWKNGRLFVLRENAVRLYRDEYFIADLIGCTIRNEENEEIGQLTDVMETGANDVYVIQLRDGRELLLPAIKQCVLQINVEEGWIQVHILDGLLED